MEDEFRHTLFPHATPYLRFPLINVRGQHLHRQPLDGAQFGESNREELRALDTKLGGSEATLELLMLQKSVLYRTWSILGKKKGLSRYFGISLCFYCGETGIRTRGALTHSHAFQAEFQYYHKLIKYIHLACKL